MKSNSQNERKSPAHHGSNEIKDKQQPDNEKSGYPHETETSRSEGISETSYSERVDVTPPTPHEFPSVGNAKTDFVSRNHGRKTGRMVGHEPGTESI